MSVLDRIERLRNVMEQQKIDCYIIPTDDYHHSEYVGDYFKFREYITGFTGSAGTAVFTKDKAGSCRGVGSRFTNQENLVFQR